MLNSLKTVVSSVVLIILVAANTQAQDQREWVDSTGKFKITGTFQKFEDGDVYLERVDGATIKIPFDNLSEADQTYVEEQRNPSADEGNAMDEGGPNRTDSVDSPNNGSDSPADDGDTVEPSRELDPVLEIESPKKINDLISSEQSEFKSEVDFALIDPLPEKMRNLALVLYNRPNTAEVGHAFAALSQQASLPPVMIQLIRESSESSNHYLRIQSLKLLAIFDPEKSFDRILDSLDDTSYHVRKTSLDLIDYLKDDRAIEHLIANFPGSERNKISTVLAGYGSKIEEAVFPLLKHERRSVVADAILLLEKIGTQKSIEEIKPLLDAHVLIRMQAQSSIEKIQKRLGQ